MTYEIVIKWLMNEIEINMKVFTRDFVIEDP